MVVSGAFGEEWAYCGINLGKGFSGGNTTEQGRVISL